MADTLSVEDRSRNMASIRSSNTKPEMYFRSLLCSAGYRYHLQNRQIPGSPDIFILKYHVAVFVHGCFWHRHDRCKYAYMPKSNVEFWEHKFSQNVARDRAVAEQLRGSGVRQLVIWECAYRKMLKDAPFAARVTALINGFVRGDETYCEISPDSVSQA